MKATIILLLLLISCTGKTKSLYSDEIKAIEKRLDALEGAARTYLIASDLVNAELKVKVSDFKTRGLNEAECPASWKKLGNSCYYFGKDRVNWNDAKEKCSKFGGHLLKIESSQENQMLFTEAKKTEQRAAQFWIGANDISKEGTWQWADKGLVQYSNWYPGQPNTGRHENCGKISISNGFRWDDYPCSQKDQYICEKEK